MGSYIPSTPAERAAMLQEIGLSDSMALFRDVPDSVLLKEKVAIPDGLPVSGVVLSDQIKSLDWRARQAEFSARLPGDAMAEVLAKVGTLLGDDED